jgi:hypothetical protein
MTRLIRLLLARACIKASICLSKLGKRLHGV